MQCDFDLAASESVETLPPVPLVRLLGRTQQP